jgi:hypothetical protein
VREQFDSEKARLYSETEKLASYKRLDTDFEKDKLYGGRRSLIVRSFIRRRTLTVRRGCKQTVSSS